MTNTVLNATMVSELVSVSYRDLTAAATTQTLTLKTLNPYAKVLGVAALINTAFVGPTAVSVEIGDNSTANAYLSSFDVKQAAGTESVGSAAHANDDIDGTSYVKAKFTSSGGNLNTCTAGQVTIQITYLHTLVPA